MRVINGQIMVEAMGGGETTQGEVRGEQDKGTTAGQVGRVEV